MPLKPVLLIPILFLLITILKSEATTAWPKNINELKAGICLVEYFQPQFEMGEITDKTRIKRKITGILVNTEGLVLTSDIIYPANLDIGESSLFYMSTQPLPEDITVSFKQDQKLKARFIGKDEESRIAFLQIIENKMLPAPVNFEALNNSTIGDPLFLIQHLNDRFDFEKIVTAHNINAVIEKPKKKLLTTTNISSLSSCGLVVNAIGNAIGIVYRSDIYFSNYEYQYDESHNDQTIIQIIPAPQFIPLLKDPPALVSQKEGGGKSWLGIQMQVLKKDMAAYWNIIDTHGIIINKVLPGSPAEKANLKPGDIILSVGDLQFTGYDKKNLDILRTYIRDLPEGNIPIRILRHKKPQDLTVRLEHAPKSRFLAEEYSNKILGLGVKELTQDYIINNELEFNTEGVWVSRVEDAGAASIGGIDINDLILRINDDEIRDLDDFRKSTQTLPDSSDEYIQIFLKRNGKTIFVFVKSMLKEKK
jgi:S1-C subfamily serine protease